MANLFFNLPAPAANGSGAAVDVSATGAVKTIVVGGTAVAQITIEFSNEAAPTSWAPLKTVQNNGKFQATVAARWMRATVAAYKRGVPEVDVGADDFGTLFATLVATAGDGVGASVDVSLLPAFKTVQISDAFRGGVVVEISEDNVAWAQCMTFLVPGAQSKVVTAQWMRVRRQNVPTIAPGLPAINVGASSDGSSSGAGPTNWQSFDYVATGLEGQQFTVPLPVAQPNATYQVRHMLGTAVRQFAVAVVDGSEAVAQFDVTVTTEPELGDVIHFDVFNP